MLNPIALFFASFTELTINFPYTQFFIFYIMVSPREFYSLSVLLT